MKRTLAVLGLTTLGLLAKAQEFKPDIWSKDLITPEVIRFCNENFPPPPYKQPVIWVRMQPLHPRFLATAEELEHGEYVININIMYEDFEMERTFIHELQHILQFYEGRLKRLEEGFFWEGALYTFDWPYPARPWEIEADQAAQTHCD